VSQLAFDEDTGRRLEAIYQIADAIRRRDLVRDALDFSGGERVLDVGCGPGFQCLELLEAVGTEGSVVGVDSSPQMLALGGRRCGPYERIDLREGRATSLPVQSEDFDRVICVQVLEYVEDFSAALAELYRVLRPGGRAVVWDVDWATVSWHTVDPARTERMMAAWDEHLTHPTLPRQLAPAMRRAGFDEVEMQPHSFSTAEFDAGAYGVALFPFIADFVAGQGEVSEQECEQWAQELRQHGERGEFYFSCTQACFTGRRPA
jgi:arsenite methyltransferase